jgi:16S rRNA (cytosine1402-N4)-methyltransferase
MTYHEPVMLTESTKALDIKAGGTYVDVTYGGGGHSAEILRQLKNGKLYAFDQDQDSQKQAQSDEQLVFINQNFKYLQNFLKMYNAIPVDGIIADLGISSHQIDEPERGFAFRHNGPLDMRMNRNQEVSAGHVVNEYSTEDLARIFREYGELKPAYKIAVKITDSRKMNPIKTSADLIDCLAEITPSKTRNTFLAKVFQALRIEVNGEMEALKELLNQCPGVLKEGAIISIITYHSLEDRLVKNFIRSGNFQGILKKDFYGNVIKPLEAINRKPIVPSEEEITRNNRARSAKLRIARKTVSIE